MAWVQELERVHSSLTACSSHQPCPTVAYVSKMIAVPSSAVPKGPGDPPRGSGDSEEVFLAFGRVFAGTLKVGDTVHVLQATYSPARPAEARQECQVRCWNAGMCVYCVLKQVLTRMSFLAEWILIVSGSA